MGVFTGIEVATEAGDDLLQGKIEQQKEGSK